jgi:5S rRNA maturation endonuclease (ribonuclease M5)
LTPHSGYKKVIKNEAGGKALFLLFDPDDGGNAFIRKFSEFLPDYMASYATGEYSSDS